MTINSEFIIFIKGVAREAGEIIRESYGNIFHRIEKSSFEFKTLIDDKVEAFVIKAIKEKYPSHGIISEESVAYQSNADYLWVIDPLDGTLNFTIGVTDLFAVSIALYFKGSPIVGVIYAPLRDDFYFAAVGRGAFKNNQIIKPADCNKLESAVVALEYGKVNRTKILKYQEKLLGESGAHYTYVFCNATVALGMVAEGRLNAYFALNLEVWDMAAGVIINREAGNIVTNSEGKEWQMGDPGILVAPPEFHKILVSYLF
jgi:myo-inositol-1(or 4)-monophosphatase